MITRLVATALMPLPAAIALVTARPAGILRLPGGRLAAGAPADLVLFDPEESWVVRGAEMASRSRNTPFEGMTLQGRVRATVLGGAPVYQRGEAGEAFAPRPWQRAQAHA